MPTLANTGLTYPTPLDPATADLWGDILNDIFIGFDAEFAVRTINQSFADKVLSRAAMKDTAEPAYNAGNLSGAVSLDYTNGHYQYGTLTGNITSLTVTNWPASGNVGFMSLELSQGATPYTLALGSAYKTTSAFGITLTASASAKDILRLETRDAGTAIFVTPNLDVR